MIIRPERSAVLYWKRCNRQGVIASALVSAGLLLGFLPRVVGLKTIDGEFLFGGAMPVALVVLCSTAALGIVTLVTPPPDKETVDKFFGEKATA